MKGFRKIVVLLGLACVVLGFSEEREEPRSWVRSSSSGVSVSYMPLFGAGVLPYHSQFSLSGGFYNLIAEGPNLHIFYGLTHQIGEQTVITGTGTEATFANEFQSYDALSLGVRFAFLKFFHLEATGRSIQNRVLKKNSPFNDYSYDGYGLMGTLAYDTRRSDFEEWYEGIFPAYPHRGVRLALGYGGDFIVEKGLYPRLEGEVQVFFPLANWWTLALRASGTGALQSLPGPYKLAFSPVGAQTAIGDWGGWGAAEVRYYLPEGGFEFFTPAFWYFASYSVQLIPGFLGGVSTSVGGSYDQPNQEVVGWSVYLAPLVGIYVMSSPMAYLRFDVVLSQHMEPRFGISINMGAVNEKPGTIFYQPL